MNRLLRKAPVNPQLLVEGDRVLVIGQARQAVEAAGVRVHVLADLDVAEAAVRMGRGEIDRVFVMTARLHENGDFGAAPGAYALAVLSKFHGIPLFVLVDRDEGEEMVPESLVTAWVRGHEITLRSRTGSNRLT